MAASLDRFVNKTHVAYLSMEMAIRSEMRTYAGGLGVLAGDTARSCADLELPMVFVTLVSRMGYFQQRINERGQQVEEPDFWEPSAYCEPLDAQIAVRIEGRPVWIRPWLYIQTSPHGHQVPIVLLDTQLDQNTPEDREITHHLYGGDKAYRLKQEIVLGIGGIRMLRALGFDIRKYHLNEGHAALLTLDLINRYKVSEDDRITGELPYDIAKIHERCVFTTHTPVASGHDRFPYDLVTRYLPELADLDTLKQLAGEDQLNMTRLALNTAGYINGVARRHAQTTERMFPGYHIHAVTNGVHAGQWTHPSFARLFNANFPQWLHEPEILVRALQLTDDEVWQCHQVAKSELINKVKAATGVSFDPDIPIIGFARRMTSYKRPLLLFDDLERLSAIAAKHPLQIVMAGKAHPSDTDGKQTIANLHQIAAQLSGKINCAYIPDYDMDCAKTLVSGVDVWLNTPLPPFEASGTSGMKAALNGVLNLSVLDGWWIEACIDGVNGWAIGKDGDNVADGDHAAALYALLENTVLPLYYTDQVKWRDMMRRAITSIAYYFNSQRMMRRYVTEAYFRNGSW